MSGCHWHNVRYEPLKNGNKLFKGDTEIVQGPTPPPAPTSTDAMNAYIQGLPQMYQAQLDWQPKLTASEIQTAQQFAPSIAGIYNQIQQQYAPQQAALDWQIQSQYAPLAVQQQQEMQRMYEPEAYAAKANLGNVVNQGNYMNTAPWLQSGSSALSGLQGLTNQDYLTNYNPETAPGLALAKDRLRGDIRGAWADRGLAQSGASAFDESKILSELELPYAQQQEAMRLSELGRRQEMALGLGQMDIGAQEAAANRYMSEIGRRQNVGLSLAGRYNVPTQPTVATPQISAPIAPTQQVGAGYSFPQVQNNMMQGYGANVAASRPLGFTQGGGGLFGFLGM